MAEIEDAISHIERSVDLITQSILAIVGKNARLEELKYGFESALSQFHIDFDRVILRDLMEKINSSQYISMFTYGESLIAHHFGNILQKLDMPSPDKSLTFIEKPQFMDLVSESEIIPDSFESPIPGQFRKILVEIEH